LNSRFENRSFSYQLNLSEWVDPASLIGLNKPQIEEKVCFSPAHVEVHGFDSVGGLHRSKSFRQPLRSGALTLASYALKQSSPLILAHRLPLGSAPKSLSRLLHTILNQVVGPFRNISWGVLYPLIRRFEEEGLIEHVQDDQPNVERGKKKKLAEKNGMHLWMSITFHEIPNVYVYRIQRKEWEKIIAS
jgi:hypothetical protein